MKNTLSLPIVLYASLLFSCVSTQSVGYVDGWVKSSNVQYSFTGPPLLAEGNGQIYHSELSGYPETSSIAIKGLDQRGLKKATNPAEAAILVSIELAESTQGKAAAMKLGGEWIPAFEVRVPYDIVIQQADGTVLGQGSGEYKNHLTLGNKQRFATEEEAIGAMDFVKTLGQESIEKKAKKDALPHALRDANKVAARLFEERNISMSVPVVRSAAGLEFEEAFVLIDEADGPSGIETALEHYQRQGTQQVKADGTPNSTANYGVACGIASCQLLLGNLSAAWESAGIALGYEPDGQEVEEIRRIIYEQEIITGQRVIPEDQRREIDAQLERLNSIESLLNNFAN